MCKATKSAGSQLCALLHIQTTKRTFRQGVRFFMPANKKKSKPKLSRVQARVIEILDTNPGCTLIYPLRTFGAWQFSVEAANRQWRAQTDRPLQAHTVNALRKAGLLSRGTDDKMATVTCRRIKTSESIIESHGE